MLAYFLTSKFLLMKRTLSAALALLLSLFIYLFYRSEKTLVNSIISTLISPETYVIMKRTIATALPLADSIVFSLPGGLWVFCATLLSRGFYLYVLGREIQVSLAPILFAISLEFFQFFHVTNGRFDLADIAFYLMFWLNAYYCYTSDDGKQNKLSPFTFDGLMCVASFLSVYLAHVGQ
jgi:hypothetical protein